MRRRLDLGAALVHRPPVLFLDEPTTGLDPASRNDLWVVIEELVADGTTVLLTTQYLEEADRLADLIAVIDGGKKIAEGTSAELKATMGATIVEIGMADREAAAGRRSAAGLGSAPSRSTTTGPRCGSTSATVPGACSMSPASSRSADLVPEAFTVREPTLDDVFLQLTGHRTDRQRRRPTAHHRSPRKVPHDGHPVHVDDRRRPGPPHRSFGWAAHDSIAIARRNLISLTRQPQLIVFSTIQPVIFVLLFTYVFGGAIDDAGRRLRRLPDAGHLLPDRGLRGHQHRHRALRRPAEGPDRAVPVAAHGPVRGAGRAARSPTWSATCSWCC